MIDDKCRLLSVCSSFRRPEMLLNMLTSWEKTKSEGSEIFVYLHMDDPFLNEYMRFIDKWPHVIDEHRNLQQVINHVVFDIYPGIPYYQIITDDAIYHTPNWDRLLIDAFEKQSNGWGFCCGRDGSNGGNWHKCQHPSMEMWSWKQANLLGYVYPRNMEALHLDYYTKQLGLAVNGLVHVPEVFIEHLWSGGCKKEPDQNIREKYNAEALAFAQAQYDHWLENYSREAIKKILEAKSKE